MTFTCADCGATAQTKTKSEEKAAQAAVKAGWMLGLPHGAVLCPACVSTRWSFISR